VARYAPISALESQIVGEIACARYVRPRGYQQSMSLALTIHAAVDGVVGEAAVGVTDG